MITNLDMSCMRHVLFFLSYMSDNDMIKMDEETPEYL